MLSRFIFLINRWRHGMPTTMQGSADFPESKDRSVTTLKETTHQSMTGMLKRSFEFLPFLSFSKSLSTSRRSSLSLDNSSVNLPTPLLNAAGSCRNTFAVSWLVKPSTSGAIQAITRFALAFLPRPRCNATDGGRLQYLQSSPQSAAAPLW
jgi:hypothetical protein